MHVPLVVSTDNHHAPSILINIFFASECKCCTQETPFFQVNQGSLYCLFPFSRGVLSYTPVSVSTYSLQFKSVCNDICKMLSSYTETEDTTCRGGFLSITV